MAILARCVSCHYCTDQTEKQNFLWAITGSLVDKKMINNLDTICPNGQCDDKQKCLTKPDTTSGQKLLNSINCKQTAKGIMKVMCEIRGPQIKN